MSSRIKRVNQLVKEELSKIILKEADLPKGFLATLTRVDVSPNLKDAKVYVSCFPEDKADFIINELSKKIYSFQSSLGKRLKMRFTPKVRFLQEKETISAGRVEEILEKLKKG